jgi:hypothetical protein
MRIGRGNRSSLRKPAPVPLCPPQIPHDLTWDRTRAVAVGSQRLTAWAMARPSSYLKAHSCRIIPPTLSGMESKRRKLIDEKLEEIDATIKLPPWKFSGILRIRLGFQVLNISLLYFPRKAWTRRCAANFGVWWCQKCACKTEIISDMCSNLGLFVMWLGCRFNLSTLNLKSLLLESPKHPPERSNNLRKALR